MAIKKQIEEIQGKSVLPCGLQLLIHQGKVLKDDTTVQENNINEDSFLVVMLGAKNKTSSASGGPSTPPTLAKKAAQANETQCSSSATPVTRPESSSMVNNESYSQAASSYVAANNREQTIQQIIDIGGGAWDRDSVERALRSAYNNPERAVEYLYSGIPESTEIALPVTQFKPGNQPQNSGAANESKMEEPTHESNAPNTTPLDLFPQSHANAAESRGILDFLRENKQFQSIRSMVQEDPQILEPMLEELSRRDPHLMALIQENHEEFLNLINEPNQDDDEDTLNQIIEEMPQTINVTPEENAAIERLVAMGFDRTLVVEAFFACDKNEELAVNYLLEHMNDELE
eukprot:TRINITY_DN11167_c0_g1_i1.p1 TRINITY_DN11167_c0_g1~~TRINITY_DN11167_c0_g1_i1.p1  ORF type:complete len:379 (-),score=87.42 TRINITY_DN11167_c0_g1_i1:36-1073(-)